MSNIKLCAFADESSAEIDLQIKALIRNAIPYLEIRNVDGVNISKITLEKAKEVKSKLDANGLAVWSLGSPYGKIKVSDDFAPHLDDFKYGIELSRELGAKCIRLFSFYEATEPSARDIVMERLLAFIEAAKGSGVILCHENEKGIYGDVASRCLDIHKNLPELKCVFDPANFIQSGQDTKEAWEMLKDYVYYMHIKDATLDGKVVPAGIGAGNLPFLVGEYSKQGGGIMTLEPHLKVFDGLAALEADEKTDIDDFTYPDNDAAFDVAANAIKEIIKSL
ncbi:MAG: sugar phosphate isomerase/epimerase [Ruminococcaceae bacterium]|nr:sugar phosphate isomerase/epimerase [Oscillospiraceae bacterium]